MKQIVINYLWIFIGPFVLGLLVRSFCNQYSKGWLVTAVDGVLVLLAYVAMRTIPNRGSELYALTLYQAIFLLFGSLLAGVWIRLRDWKRP